MYYPEFEAAGVLEFPPTQIVCFFVQVVVADINHMGILTKRKSKVGFGVTN